VDSELIKGRSSEVQEFKEFRMLSEVGASVFRYHPELLQLPNSELLFHMFSLV
jgi:hypothetical protein